MSIYDVFSGGNRAFNKRNGLPKSRSSGKKPMG